MGDEMACAHRLTSRRKRYQCGVYSALDSSRWIKLSTGLDDFRYGPPHKNAGRILPASPAIRVSGMDLGSESTSEAISSSSLVSERGQMSVLDLSQSISYERGLSPTSSCHSRRGFTGQKIRHQVQKKQDVLTIEQKLKENPLILFPYLESNLPHEVFEKLISILGPTPGLKVTEPLTTDTKTEETSRTTDEKIAQSRKLYSRRTIGSGKRRDTAEEKSTQSPLVQQAMQQIVSGDLVQESIPSGFTDQLKEMSSVKKSHSYLRSPTSDPYRSFLKRVNYNSSTITAQKKKTKVLVTKPSEEEELDLRQIADDFCNWMQSMGGEERVDADKIITLFGMNTDVTSDIETMIQVLDEFPLSTEEQEAAKRTSSKLAVKPSKLLPAEKMDRAKQSVKTFKCPEKRIRYRYGAWYLDVSSWKKLAPWEKLEDHEELEKRRRVEEIICSDKLDQQLKLLHSYKALKDYYRRNGIKMPNKNFCIDVTKILADLTRRKHF